MRIVKMLIALPMILLLGILRLLAAAISWLYCRAASLVFAPLVICLILASNNDSVDCCRHFRSYYRSLFHITVCYWLDRGRA